MRKGKFDLDFLEGYSFEGFTQDEDWNGFACPYFTFEQAQQLVCAWNEIGSNAAYDSSRDQFNFQMQDGDTESFSVVEVEDRKLYPIGNGSWIWEEVSE